MIFAHFRRGEGGGVGKVRRTERKGTSKDVIIHLSFNVERITIEENKIKFCRIAKILKAVKIASLPFLQNEVHLWRMDAANGR